MKILKHKLDLTQNPPQTSKPALAQHDYKPALQSAVSWLGDRYLLAEPVRKLADDRKTFFVESRQWHPATRH